MRKLVYNYHFQVRFEFATFLRCTNRLHRSSKASPYLQRVAFSDHGQPGKVRGPRPISAVSRTSDKKRIDIKFMTDTKDGDEEEESSKPMKKRPESAPVYKTKRYLLNS